MCLMIPSPKYTVTLPDVALMMLDTRYINRSLVMKVATDEAN